MKKRIVPEPYVGCIDSLDPPYPSELLSDLIQRALDQGVSPEVTVSLMYDDADSLDIDPDCDIRTDRFAIAEASERQRSAAKAMSDAAAAATVVDPSPIPPVPPLVDPVDSPK